MKYLVSTALAVVLSVAPVQAQHRAEPRFDVNLQVSVKDPLLGLDSKTFAAVVKKLIDPRSIVGKPDVYVVNATPDELTVNCDSWVLVGDKPYIVGNPRALRPWSATLVNAKGFDGYCKGGLTASAASGEVYKGTLNGPTHTFSDSTFVTITSESAQ